MITQHPKEFVRLDRLLTIGDRLLRGKDSGDTSPLDPKVIYAEYRLCEESNSAPLILASRGSRSGEACLVALYLLEKT